MFSGGQASAGAADVEMNDEKELSEGENAKKKMEDTVLKDTMRQCAEGRGIEHSRQVGG